MGQDLKRDGIVPVGGICRADKANSKTEDLGTPLDGFEVLKPEVRLCTDLRVPPMKKRATLASLRGTTPPARPQRRATATTAAQAVTTQSSSSAGTTTTPPPDFATTPTGNDAFIVKNGWGASEHESETA